jgi:hypothetical protein
MRDIACERRKCCFGTDGETSASSRGRRRSTMLCGHIARAVPEVGPSPDRRMSDCGLLASARSVTDGRRRCRHLASWLANAVATPGFSRPGFEEPEHASDLSLDGNPTSSLRLLHSLRLRHRQPTTAGPATRVAIGTRAALSVRRRDPDAGIANGKGFHRRSPPSASRRSRSERHRCPAPRRWRQRAPLAGGGRLAGRGERPPKIGKDPDASSLTPPPRHGTDSRDRELGWIVGGRTLEPSGSAATAALPSYNHRSDKVDVKSVEVDVDVDRDVDVLSPPPRRRCRALLAFRFSPR